MKMMSWKKWIKATLCLWLILFLFPVTTFAHPGNTDSNGGHKNRSTGEYHYHHGYAAHSHYDFDGNGIADCPYDFKDKAETSPNQNSSISLKIDWRTVVESLPALAALFGICCIMLSGVIGIFNEDIVVFTMRIGFLLLSIAVLLMLLHGVCYLITTILNLFIP